MAPEQVFTCRNGAVFYRGCFMRPEDAEKTLVQLKGSGAWAEPIVHQLEAAISETAEITCELAVTETPRPSIPSRAGADQENYYAIPKSSAA